MRRRVVMETYLRAVSEGDQNVWFVDGTSFLSMDDRFDGTVDGTHPNDLGQHRMAKIIGEVIASVLRR